MITLDMLRQRREVLASEQRQLEAAMMQAKADHDAYNGAIGELDRLIEFAAAEEVVAGVEHPGE